VVEKSKQEKCLLSSKRFFTFHKPILNLSTLFITPLIIIFFNQTVLFSAEIKGEYKLVWGDEFNYEGRIDAQKWFHQTIIPNGKSWFNDEIQHYTNRIDNSFVNNGSLKIVVKKEEYFDQNQLKKYTSARINSKFSFTYGRIEIRAKLPVGVGLWPAIWMLGQNINEKGAYWETKGFGNVSWPNCGEIDILEHWGRNKNYVQSALHTPSSFGDTKNFGGRDLSNVNEKYNVYSLDWTKDKMIFSINDTSHYEYAPDHQDSENWPFNNNQYLILNIAVEPTIYPEFLLDEMEIDYIRIYQHEKKNNEN
jgi:beta-glucanase (GH16 family)